jgi:hypothetical protein
MLLAVDGTKHFPESGLPEFWDGIVVNDFHGWKTDDFNALVTLFKVCGFKRKLGCKNSDTHAFLGEVFVEFIRMGFQASSMGRVVGRKDQDFHRICQM